MNQEMLNSKTKETLLDTLLPLWKTNLFTLSEEDTNALNFSILQNVNMISKLFDTEEKLQWLKNHKTDFRKLVKECFFNKDHFLYENYQILERRLEECFQM